MTQLAIEEANAQLASMRPDHRRRMAERSETRIHLASLLREDVQGMYDKIALRRFRAKKPDERDALGRAAYYLQCALRDHYGKTPQVELKGTMQYFAYLCATACTGEQAMRIGMQLSTGE